MGISTEFLDELIKVVPSAFNSNLPSQLRIDCIIFDGTQELKAFLRAGSSNNNSNNLTGLQNQKIYAQIEQNGTAKWFDILNETPNYHNITSIICMIDVDRKIPVAKNVERSNSREYNAYTVTDMIRLEMIKHENRFTRNIGYIEKPTPVDDGGDSMVVDDDVMDNQSFYQHDNTEKVIMVLNTVLLNDYMWGDPNRVWATIPLRTILKNKYCEGIKAVFANASFLNIPASKSLEIRNRQRIDSSESYNSIDLANNNNSKEQYNIKEDFAMAEVAVRHKCPIFFLDGISRKIAEPDIMLSSVERMEEDIRTSRFEFKTSPSNKPYLEDASLTIKSELGILDSDSIDAPGIYAAPLGCNYKDNNSMDVSSSTELFNNNNNKKSQFMVNELHTPGESDLKACNYIHPDFGCKFIVRSDDTDFIPILLLRIQKWYATKAHKDLPEIWMDRTCNYLLRQNLSNNKRYINITQIWKYYVLEKNVPIERLVLTFLLKKTDYVTPFDKLNNDVIPGIDPQLGMKPRVHIYGAGKLMGKDGIEHQKFKESILVTNWGSNLDEKSTYKLDEHRLRDFLFSRYYHQLLTSCKDDNFKQKFQSLRTLEDMHNVLSTYNKTSKQKILMTIPTHKQLKSNVRRISWNFNYWLNGTLDARVDINYDDESSCALECVRTVKTGSNSYESRFGWDLEQVPDNAVNPLDITQLNVSKHLKDIKVFQQLGSGSGSIYNMYTTRKMYFVKLSDQVTSYREPQIPFN